jgi:hypothetical protein
MSPECPGRSPARQFCRRLTRWSKCLVAASLILIAALQLSAAVEAFYDDPAATTSSSPLPNHPAGRPSSTSRRRTIYVAVPLPAANRLVVYRSTDAATPERGSLDGVNDYRSPACWWPGDQNRVYLAYIFRDGTSTLGQVHGLVSPAPRRLDRPPALSGPSEIFRRSRSIRTR